MDEIASNFLRQKTTITGWLSSFEILSGNCKYIYNNRIDLETVLSLTCLLWPQLLFVLSRCSVGNVSLTSSFFCSCGLGGVMCSSRTMWENMQSFLCSVCHVGRILIYCLLLLSFIFSIGSTCFALLSISLSRPSCVCVCVLAYVRVHARPC